MHGFIASCPGSACVPVQNAFHVVFEPDRIARFNEILNLDVIDPPAIVRAAGSCGVEHKPQLDDLVAKVNTGKIREVEYLSRPR